MILKFSGSSFRTEPEANPLFSVSFHSVLKITHYFQDPTVLNGENGLTRLIGGLAAAKLIKAKERSADRKEDDGNKTKTKAIKNMIDRIFGPQNNQFNFKFNQDILPRVVDIFLGGILLAKTTNAD